MKQSKLLRAYLSLIIFSLFQRGGMLEGITDEASELDSDEPDFTRIRCPLCSWHPSASNRWMCADCDYPEYFYAACETVWNTFTTRGLCPGCGHLWRWTSCLRCWGWSLHEDWYVKENED